MHVAARCGQTHLVQWLLANGATPSLRVKDRLGSTPLEIAQIFGPHPGELGSTIQHHPAAPPPHRPTAPPHRRPTGPLIRGRESSCSGTTGARLPPEKKDCGQGQNTAYEIIFVQEIVDHAEIVHP